MEALIANVDCYEFKIERDLNEQYGALSLPFPGMDSKWGYVILQTSKLNYFGLSIINK